MEDYIATYHGIPIFSANIGEPNFYSFENFATVLRKTIYEQRGISTWVETLYSAFDMRLRVTVIQDKFMTIDRLITTHDENGNPIYTFKSDRYPNENSKVIATFYLTLNRFLSPMIDETYIELVNLILPEKKEEAPKEEGKTLVALQCPTCGGTVNPNTMTCDYCGTKVLWR